MDSIPRYLRGGRALPLRERARRSTAAAVRDPLTLLVALDPRGQAQGELYLDDGRSYAFQRGQYGYRHFEFKGGAAGCDPGGWGQEWDWGLGGAPGPSKGSCTCVAMVSLEGRPSWAAMQQGCRVWLAGWLAGWSGCAGGLGGRRGGGRAPSVPPAHHPSPLPPAWPHRLLCQPPLAPSLSADGKLTASAADHAAVQLPAPPAADFDSGVSIDRLVVLGLSFGPRGWTAALSSAAVAGTGGGSGRRRQLEAAPRSLWTAAAGLPEVAVVVGKAGLPAGRDWQVSFSQEAAGAAS